MGEKDGKSRNRGLWRPIVLIVMIVAALVIARVLGLGERLEALQGWIKALGFWGNLVFVGIYIVAVVTGIPGSAITIAAGVLFGSVVGVTLVSASNGLTEQYIQLLADNFNPDTARNIMCRTLISVDWEGALYNCDFNLAAGLPIGDKTGRILQIDDIEDTIQSGHEIVTAEHCYCCTAGAGSSCTGALV